MTAQYPTATLRPFATAGLAVFSLKPDWSSTGLLGPVFSLDLGLAWSAW